MFCVALEISGFSFPFYTDGSFIDSFLLVISGIMNLVFLFSETVPTICCYSSCVLHIPLDVTAMEFTVSFQNPNYQ
jgi:hypothetical protein